YHSDSSAAIVEDGVLRFAIAEERLNRVKHCGSFPRLAIQACLDAVGARIQEVDHVAIGRSTRANLAQKVRYALKDPSKLPKFARCQGHQIEPLRRVFVPHSLGFLYTAGSQFIGYQSYGDEGKVMGLAPYGRPSFTDEFARIVSPARDGFELNGDYFVPLGADQGLQIEGDGTVTCPPLFTPRWVERFGEARVPRSEVTQRDMDVAFALQDRFQEIAFHLWNELHRAVPSTNLSMAGGCALNSVANGML